MKSRFLFFYRRLQAIQAAWLNRSYYPWLLRGTGRRRVREASEWRVKKLGVAWRGGPEVLILGDSIARDFFPALVQLMGEEAVLSLYATSQSIGDPTLPGNLRRFLTLTRSYSLVAFSNGLHGWNYTEEEYGRFLHEFITAIQEGAPQARLIWLATTPVTRNFPGGPTPERVAARNALARAEAARRGIPFLELPAPPDEDRDGIHFTPAGSRLQAERLAQVVRKELSLERRQES